LDYASQYLTTLTIPKIIYRPASIFTREELTDWLNRMQVHGFQPVFVGLPSPDYVPKTSLSEAYEIWRNHHQSDSVMGAVVIPERHVILKDEDVRILEKMGAGVTHFISQCIFDVACTQQTLDALVASCEKRNQPLPTIIFTLTICGSPKTLQFMEWLGIQMPLAIKEELMTCSNPTARSVEIATAISTYLIEYCLEKSIPFGFNIESVAIRKEEIQASLQLLGIVHDLLKQNGLRHESSQPVAAPL
jgi:5,10-methylenetetrahydrofolate reductase